MQMNCMIIKEYGMINPTAQPKMSIHLSLMTLQATQRP